MPGRLYSLFRKIALLGPTEEEMDRMDREDREANRVRIPGKPTMYYGITAFGQRVEHNLEDILGDSHVPSPEPVSNRAMPGRLYSLFRKITLLGPTEEEMDRMDREDREANIVHTPGDGPTMYYGITAFGQRVEEDVDIEDL